jgi:hypothetical protein
MKANELRIGNFIMFSETGAKFRVVEIDNYGFRVANANEDTWIGNYNFEGIPLTEEWLLKLGFILLSESKYSKKFECINNDSFCFSFPKLGANVHHYGMSYRGELLSNIKHVHQLQNLYFALTGEELTIKE